MSPTYVCTVAIVRGPDNFYYKLSIYFSF